MAGDYGNIKGLVNASKGPSAKGMIRDAKRRPAPIPRRAPAPRKPSKRSSMDRSTGR